MKAQEVSMTTVTKRITKFSLLVAVLICTCSATAQAQPFRHGGFGFRAGIYEPRFWGPYYGPFWGPYYHSYGVYPFLAVHPTADVRVEAVPKQAEVFIDGYYAGVASDFGGTFKRLHTTPGGHAITLFLPGYRTVTESIYVRPDSTFKMNERMDKLGAAEVSTPPPSPISPVSQ